MAIVDFHSHFFCRTYFQTLAGMSKLPGDAATRMADVASKVRLELPHEDVEQHLARWISELDRHGVEHMATFASVPEELPDVVRAARASNGRLSAFALVNPRAEGAAAKLDRALAAGDVRGALVFPAMHHFELSGPEAAEVFRVLDAHGAIVFVHCGILVVKLRDLFGLPRVQDVRFANPLSLIPAANAHPRATFVIPHFGAGFLRETLMAGAQTANIYVDTSSSNGWMATQEPKLTLRDVFERALGVFGASRILFGTDSNVFPAGWRKDRYDEQRAAVNAAGASAADQELIFAGNARRLLKLEER
ncbi:MAG: amidohydrolase family protein [Planctomycetota bacterium]